MTQCGVEGPSGGNGREFSESGGVLISGVGLGLAPVKPPHEAAQQ